VGRKATERNRGFHPEWGEVTGDLYLNDLIFFSHVPKSVWQYELGGYPVLKKWLGYRLSERRAGAPLSLSELEWFRSIVLRVAALLLTRPQLEHAYEKATGAAWSVDELFLT